MDEYSQTNTTAALTAEIVRNTFSAFAAAMYSWEKDFYKKRLEVLDGNGCRSTLLEKGRADLLIIFSAHVIDKGRNYDRVENLVCGANPEYDINEKSVKVSITKKNTVTVVFEKNSGSFEQYRLSLTETNGKLMIQNRKFNDEEKWISTYV
ncbi:NTF2 fold immunity protein [Pseudomonas syringae USA007]|uniref:NTF2 fold immunity protein n=1 Tax=Pseudomonas syringae USA007 TaxID=1357288 RepID=A0AAU8MAF8_PSESX|nr:NTF2 fold immunity protein [Pseudomonas syringae]